VFAYDCVYARVCSMSVIVFYKRPRNHIQMSGPDYEEFEINEITKLTIDARGTGVAVRARAVRPGGMGRGGRGEGDGTTFRAPRAIASTERVPAAVRSARRVAIRFTTIAQDLVTRSRARIRIASLTTTPCPWTLLLVA